MLNLVKNGVRRAKTNGGIAPVSLALSTDGSTELSELKGQSLTIWSLTELSNPDQSDLTLKMFGDLM